MCVFECACVCKCAVFVRECFSPCVCVFEGVCDGVCVCVRVCSVCERV